jgi:hypothetical protein
VIPITRLDLDAQLSGKLDALTTQLGNEVKPPVARDAWKAAHKERQKVRSYLSRMAVGIQRCMYCGDSLGTDIDHFEPIVLRPSRAFDWLNHLLACSSCNSNYKRDKFPRADLARGREGAFLLRRATICYAHTVLRQDRLDEATRCLRALAEEPHASVLHAMLRLLLTT